MRGRVAASSQAGPSGRSSRPADGPAGGGAGKEHAVLAYLITEPELSSAGPLDATLAVRADEAPPWAALAYAGAPDPDDPRWIPAGRRRPAPGVPLA
jgi:hypothetical protein